MKSDQNNNYCIKEATNGTIMSGNQLTSSQSLDIKYRDKFTGMLVDSGCEVFNSMKEISTDYKTIDKDNNLSSVDKAIGKRKILVLDIVIGTVAIASSLGLARLAKIVFST